MTVTISPKPRKIPFIWAMNILAVATKRAVPSMLMLQPIGRTNLVTLGSTLSLSVISRNVTGSAAALRKARLENITKSPSRIIVFFFVSRRSCLRTLPTTLLGSGHSGKVSQHFLVSKIRSSRSCLYRHSINLFTILFIIFCCSFFLNNHRRRISYN